MLLRQVNKAMLLEDTHSKYGYSIYVENAKTTVEIDICEASLLELESDEIFEAIVNLKVNEAEYEIFLRECQEEEEEETCNEHN
jgi:hypothetical protein